MNSVVNFSRLNLKLLKKGMIRYAKWILTYKAEINVYYVRLSLIARIEKYSVKSKQIISSFDDISIL